MQSANAKLKFLLSDEYVRQYGLDPREGAYGYHLVVDGARVVSWTPYRTEEEMRRAL